MLKNILLVGFGGFAGSVARYFVSKLNLSIDFYAIPIGTLAVNVFGSYVIGFLTGLSEKTTYISTDIRLLLMVGICGGFTTFSTFTHENLNFMQNGLILSILLYTALSIFLGFLFVYLGYITSSLL